MRRRQLQGSAVHGDVTDDGVTNALDLTAIVNYFKAPNTLSIGSMSENQKLWIDANRDGVYANAGDVLYAARAFAGATAYPVFEDLACPTSESADVLVTVTCYSAGQAVLGAVEVAVELTYSGTSATAWTVSSGQQQPSPASTQYFNLGQSDGSRELRVVHPSGWENGETLSISYVVGVLDNSESRAILPSTTASKRGAVAVPTFLK